MEDITGNASGVATGGRAAAPAAPSDQIDGMRNVADLVRRAADRRGAGPALIFRDTVLTWSQTDARVDRTAASLRALGLRDGDRLAFALPNSADTAVLYFAALRAGLVAVPTNPLYTARELHHVLGDSGAVALVATPAAADVVAGVRDQLPALAHVLTMGSGQDGPVALPDPGPALPAGSARGGEDLAVLMYTSGTSGRPRGAMLSHRALLANLEQVSRIQPPVLQADDVTLLVLPLHHIYGLGPVLGQATWEGCPIVIAERFDPVDTLHLIAEKGVTHVPGAPPMFVAWSLLPDFAEVFCDVRLAVSGAAPLPADAQRRLLEATGRHVFEGYGLTETAPVVTSTLLSEVPKPNSIGRPLPGVELRLVDPASGTDLAEVSGSDDDEDPLGGPVDDPGEIVVRGRNLFSGYWPDGADGPDADGWWHTGDIAYVDVDGDLFLVDRMKELILVSGFNVYPREVEDVLLAHPAIADAGVIGVPHPYTGETVKAYVVTRPGEHLSAEDVVGHCERMLARFKCPTAVAFVESLPHSVTGKVSKAKLRDRDQDPTGDQDPTAGLHPGREPDQDPTAGLHPGREPDQDPTGATAGTSPA